MFWVCLFYIVEIVYFGFVSYVVEFYFILNIVSSGNSTFWVCFL